MVSGSLSSCSLVSWHSCVVCSLPRPTLAPAEPRPQVVRDLLAFLAGRILEIEEAGTPDDAEDAARMKAELQMTDRLIDLVLYRYHGLRQEQIEQLEAARTS